MSNTAQIRRTRGTHHRDSVGQAPAVWWRRGLTRVKRLARRTMARPGMAHLKAALERSTDRLATHFAAAITYFSFLSLIPILMVSFSVAGFVLVSHPDLLDSLKDEVISFVPDSFQSDISDQIDRAVKQRLTVGIIGLVTALYSGLNWIHHVRQAIRAQWRPRWIKEKRATFGFGMRYVWDLISLAGLLVAVVITFGLTAVGTSAQQLVVGWLGIGDVPVLHTLLQVGPTVIAILADVLVFAWVYTILPFKEYRADKRTLLIGSLAMAICFEILKSALTIIIPRMSDSPSGAVFGSIIGLLLFFNLVARAFLMIGAWIATGAEHVAAVAGHPDTASGEEMVVDEADLTPVPARIVLQRPPSRSRNTAAFGAGALLGWLAGARRRR